MPPKKKPSPSPRKARKPIAKDGARSANRQVATSVETRNPPVSQPKKAPPAGAGAAAERARLAGVVEDRPEGNPVRTATGLSWAQSGDRLTTAQGLRVDDADNSLKAGERGPTLLEDFHLREKITHFDHERIPERVVHARGAGAHGVFEATEGLDDLCAAGRSCARERRHRCSCASRPWPGRGARPTPPAMFGASPRSSTRRRATSIWSATTSRSSSSRTG